jgi:hypothetical protein
MKINSLFLVILSAIIPIIYAADYPPPAHGKIWQGYSQQLNATRTRLVQVIAAVPPGESGQGSAWFAKLQAIKAQLDVAAGSLNQTELISLIQQLADVFTNNEAPPFIVDAYGSLANLSVPLLGTVATHVAQQNGNVANSTLTSLVTMFRIGEGFISEANWEKAPMPIDAAGVMILDATVVVSQLKSGQWTDAKRFLGGVSSAQIYFARYAPNGDGLSALRTKYFRNKSVIDAKFLELKSWVTQQEAAAGTP